MAIQLRKPIRIEHAIASKEFVEAIDDLIAQKLRQLQRRLNLQRRQDDIILARTLLSTLRDKSRHDMMVNTLLGLQYEEFSVNEYDGAVYLIGLTKPITLECYVGGWAAAPDCRYNIGPYYVCMKGENLIHGTAEQISLLPKKNIRAVQRTPHHWGEAVPDKHPIAWRPYTCLGSFQGGIVGAVQQLNIVECFRVWHMYISRANLNSQLYSPGAHYGDGSTLDLMDWKELVDENPS